MLTVLSVIGTRPEAIKMAPVINELERYDRRIRSVVCSTGQHRHMLDQVCELFGIRPDIDLNVMQPDQRLADLTARLFRALDSVIEDVKPDVIFGSAAAGNRQARMFSILDMGIRHLELYEGLLA